MDLVEAESFGKELSGCRSVRGCGPLEVSSITVIKCFRNNQKAKREFFFKKKQGAKRPFFLEGLV